MFARAGLTLSLTLTASLAAAQGFEYAPGSAQYKVHQTTKIKQEAMGQSQEFGTTSEQIFTATMARAGKDTLVVTYVVDSLLSSNTMGVPMPGLSGLKGLTVDVKASPTAAVVYSVSGPTEEQMQGASAMVTALGAFLPKMQARVAKGTAWTDTATFKMKQMGVDIERKVKSRYAVLGDTTVAGASAWKVQKTDSASITGSGSGQAGPMTMEGTSVATAVFVMTPKGMVLGADGSEESNVRVVLSANGVEINTTSSARTTLSKLK